MASASVIIPTYNRARLLGRALASVYAQTRPADQVIVVDDGSTDNSEQLLRPRFRNVQWLRQERAGVSAARNRGILAATGGWIALLDSDDEWLPTKLERQLSALHEQPGYRICHTDEIWIRDGRRVNPMNKHAKHGGHIFQHCLPRCAISPSSALIERCLLDEVGLFDADLPACEDYDLWLRICAQHAVLLVPEPLVVKYGGHADQLSRQHWGMDRFRIQALERIVESGQLAAEDAQAAQRMLVDKIDVYLLGATKRGKWHEAECYRQKRQRWAQAR